MNSNKKEEGSIQSSGSGKPLISTFTAILIGGIGVYEIDKRFFAEHRYPVSVEYEVVDACVNSSRAALSSDQYKRKKEICSCALEKTQKDFPYKEMRKDESGFISRLRESAKGC